MTIYSSSPVIGKSKLALIKPMNIQMKCVDVDVNLEVEWLLDSETQVEFHHGGKVLKNGACYNDFYGFLTCMDEDNGEDAANDYSITPESSLEVKMITTVSVIPVIRVDGDDVVMKKQRFTQVESGLWHCVKDGFKPCLLERVELNKVCSWSSKGLNTELQQARSELKEFFNAEHACHALSERLKERGVEITFAPSTENAPAQ